MSNITPIDEVRNALTKMGSQFQMALPRHINVERFTRVIQTAIGQTPALLKADRNSLYAACMKAAQSGLLPDGKESAIVTFGDKAQFMPMVAGILKQVRNSGELASITSQLVYEKDAFKYWIDSDGEHIEHTPNVFGERGVIKGAYALAKMKDSSVYIELMTMDQLNAVKKTSRSQNGPWSGPFESEMQKKTVIRRLAKRLPLSTDIEHVIKADDDLYDLDATAPAQQPQQEKEVTESAPSQKKASRLKSLVNKPAAQEETVLHSSEHIETTQDNEGDLPI